MSTRQLGDCWHLRMAQRRARACDPRLRQRHRRSSHFRKRRRLGAIAESSAQHCLGSTGLLCLETRCFSGPTRRSRMRRRSGYSPSAKPGRSTRPPVLPMFAQRLSPAQAPACLRSSPWRPRSRRRLRHWAPGPGCQRAPRSTCNRRQRRPTATAFVATQVATDNVRRNGHRQTRSTTALPVHKELRHGRPRADSGPQAGSAPWTPRIMWTSSPPWTGSERLFQVLQKSSRELPT
mmetsp:Transcript_76728/g.221730  ORF Transcript_76728/g.221730 Transcript_76728/m.221730 type:complete len:235 (+) Transcript_76728:154-858(+)